MVLLIRKRRGLGAGKINAPGGRIDPGETPIACAMRETEEELHVRPLGLSIRGELRFQFVDGYSIHAYVFIATGHRGTPTETDEAIPIWTSVHLIPYEEMWVDDALWVPRLLAGECFSGCFVFDGDRMRDHEVRSLGPEEVTALEVAVSRIGAP